MNQAELLSALKVLHKILEIALENEQGVQCVYLETRKKSFVRAMDAMKIAERAITNAELESPKSQLAEVCDDYKALTECLGNSLKREHVMRGALEEYVGVVVSVNNPDNFNVEVADGGKAARDALSLKAIEGYVVCKDEPIYQEFDKGTWEDIDKEQYDFKLDEGWPKLRIVYAPADQAKGRE